MLSNSRKIANAFQKQKKIKNHSLTVDIELTYLNF